MKTEWFSNTGKTNLKVISKESKIWLLIETSYLLSIITHVTAWLHKSSVLSEDFLSRFHSTWDNSSLFYAADLSFDVAVWTCRSELTYAAIIVFVIFLVTQYLDIRNKNFWMKSFFVSLLCFVLIYGLLYWAMRYMSIMWIIEM